MPRSVKDVEAALDTRQHYWKSAEDRSTYCGAPFVSSTRKDVVRTVDCPECIRLLDEELDRVFPESKR